MFFWLTVVPRLVHVRPAERSVFGRTFGFDVRLAKRSVFGSSAKSCRTVRRTFGYGTVRFLPNTFGIRSTTRHN